MAKNQDEEVLMDENDEASLDPRVYELGFHLDPELPVEEVKKVYQAIHALVEGKATVVATVEPEKIQLAYTISRQEVAGRRDFNSAYFSWVVYETTAPSHAEVIAAVRANASVIRFIDVITTKDAARHALEVHELLAKAPAPAVDPEDVLNTEIDAALETATI